MEQVVEDQLMQVDNQEQSTEQLTKSFQKNEDLSFGEGIELNLNNFEEIIDKKTE